MPSEELQYVLLIGSGDKTKPEATASFSSLEEALRAVGPRHFQPTDVVGGAGQLPGRVEILCKRPEETVVLKKRPRYRFYVNVQASEVPGIEGEGTESFPWWGSKSAT